MANTVGYFVQMIQEEYRRIFAKGDPSDSFNIETQDVAMRLDAAIQQVIATHWADVSGYPVNGSWLRAVEIKPVVSTRTCAGKPMYEYDLSQLGFRLQSLPDDRGLWMITDNSGIGYTRVEPDYVLMASGLPAFTMMSRIAYYQQGNTLYFVRAPKCEVILYCVPLCYDASPDDNFPCPAQYHSEVISMVYDAMKLMMGMSDETNDKTNN